MSRDLRAVDEGTHLFAFENASHPQQTRALVRELAVKAYLEFLGKPTSAGSTTAKRQWVSAYKSEHSGLRKLSLPTIERWRERFESRGRDGLVDRNDGSARRGKRRIPAAVLEFFREQYLGGNGNVALAIFDTRIWAEHEAGIKVTAHDSSFRRYAATIPRATRRLRLEDRDAPERVTPSARRNYSTIAAMHGVQADHHIADVWVRCDDQRCPRGHRPWITTFIDVRSRRVVSWIASLGYPNSDRVLAGFRQLVDQYGLPDLVHIDNGKDFKKAFGKAVRAGDTRPLDQRYFSNLLLPLAITPIYATPYRAQAKHIERMFGTWVARIWKGSDAYVGKPGKRTKASHRLFSNPSLLPGLEEFKEQMAVEIAIYETSSHRGQGMNGRSPLEVFNATLIPVRKPEQRAWELVFWTHYVRMIGGAAGPGAVQIGPDRYRVGEPAAYDHQGKYVQVLVNPDDVRQAIVLSACEHCDARTSRARLFECSCATKGRYLAEACLWGASTWSSADPITRENQRLVKGLERDYKRRAKEGSLEARAAVRQFKGANRLSILRRVAEKRRVEQTQSAVAVGETTYVVPRYSHISRERSDLQSLIESTHGLTAAQLALADSVTEDHTDQFLESISSRNDLDIRPVGSSQTETSAEDRARFERERARMRRGREQERKRKERECLAEDCREPAEIGEYCEAHWRAEHPDMYDNQGEDQ